MERVEGMGGTSPALPAPSSTVLFAVFAAALAVQLLYWAVLGVGFSRVRERQPADEGPPPDLPLAVVVAARDERANLPALLDALERQALPPPEVGGADGGSRDATASLVEARAAAWAAAGGPVDRKSNVRTPVT